MATNCSNFARIHDDLRKSMQHILSHNLDNEIGERVKIKLERVCDEHLSKVHALIQPINPCTPRTPTNVVLSDPVSIKTEREIIDLESDEDEDIKIKEETAEPINDCDHSNHCQRKTDGVGDCNMTTNHLWSAYFLCNIPFLGGFLDFSFNVDIRRCGPIYVDSSDSTTLTTEIRCQSMWTYHEMEQYLNDIGQHRVQRDNHRMLCEVHPFDSADIANYNAFCRYFKSQPRVLVASAQTDHDETVCFYFIAPDEHIVPDGRLQDIFGCTAPSQLLWCLVVITEDGEVVDTADCDQSDDVQNGEIGEHRGTVNVIDSNTLSSSRKCAESQVYGPPGSESADIPNSLRSNVATAVTALSAQKEVVRHHGEMVNPTTSRNTEVYGPSACNDLVQSSNAKEINPQRLNRWKCPDGCCQRQCINDDDLQQHMETEHAWYCYICHRDFKSEAEFQSHLTKRKHLQLIAKECTHCGMAFRGITALKKHRQKYHVLPNGANPGADPGADPLRYPVMFVDCKVRCKVKSCLMWFADLKAMNLHLQRTHKICSECCSVFSNAKQHRAHIMKCPKQKRAKQQRKMEGDHQCDFCDRQFRKRSDLKQHIKAKHGGSKRFECGFCRKAFAAKSELTRHELRCLGTKQMTTTTTAEMSPMSPSKVHCEHCGKAFPSSTKRRKHEKRCHFERGINTLSNAGKPWTQNESETAYHFWKTHGRERSYKEIGLRLQRSLEEVRAHLEGLPFKCQFCEYRCLTQKRKSRHEAKCQRSLRKFQCEFCEHRCQSAAKKKKHQRSCRHVPVTKEKLAHRQMVKERRALWSKGVNTKCNARKRWTERDSRYVFSLWKDHGKSHEEIGQRVQRSEKAVAAQLNLIRRAIEHLEPKQRDRAMQSIWSLKGSLLELLKQQRARDSAERMQAVEQENSDEDGGDDDDDDDGDDIEGEDEGEEEGACCDEDDDVGNRRNMKREEWSPSPSLSTSNRDDSDFDITLSPPPSLPMLTEQKVNVKIEDIADSRKCTNDLEMKLFDRVLDV